MKSNNEVKETKKEIFDFLNDEGLNYFVMVSRIYLSNLKETGSGLDYRVFVMEKDVNEKNTKDYNFNISIDKKTLLEKVLNQKQIKKFKKISGKYFIKKQHNEFGKIYELKNNSFKNYYKNQLT